MPTIHKLSEDSKMSNSTGYSCALECLPIPQHDQALIDKVLEDNKELSAMGYIAGLDHFGLPCFNGKLYG